MQAITRSEVRSNTKPGKLEFLSDLHDHPFFNWRWSVADVALVVMLLYTLH